MLLCRLMFQIDGSGSLTLHTCYLLLTTQVHPPLDDSENLIWHPQVSLKVSIFAWRLFRDRLPTKYNLLNRGIILVADANCLANRGHSESAPHLFLQCATFSKIWLQVRLWIGVLGVDHNNLRNHFVQLTSCLVPQGREDFSYSYFGYFLFG